MARQNSNLLFFVKFFAVTIFSVVLLAVLFEIYLRQRGFLKAQPANYPCITGDPVLNHVFRPSCEGVLTGAELKTDRPSTFKTNSLGLRGSEFRGGSPLIVLLGDSYTEGFGVNDDESLPFVLQKKLQTSTGPTVEVLNGGTLGYSTVLYPLYYERYFSHLKPRLVLLAVDFTDLQDNSYYLQLANFNQVGDPVSFPTRDAFLKTLLPLVYSNKSALLRFLHQEWNQWNLIKLRNFNLENMNALVKDVDLSWSESLISSDLKGCEKPLALIVKTILDFRDRLTKDKVSLAIHVYPPGYLVKNYPSQASNVSIVQWLDQKTRRDFTWSCQIGPKFVEFLRDFSKRNSIPFRDGFSLIQAKENKSDLYFNNDAHWNEKGIRVAAEGLEKFISSILAQKKSK